MDEELGQHLDNLLAEALSLGEEPFLEGRRIGREALK